MADDERGTEGVDDMLVVGMQDEAVHNFAFGREDRGTYLGSR